jgi:O-acetyl-ADP-ribose deacetylase (regulator of RNase III)
MSTVQPFHGNLFDYFDRTDDIYVNAIAHVCNCQGVMGSGIAQSIKMRYPSAYKAYRRFEEVNSGLRLGTISHAEVKPGKHVFNLHAQQFYGTDRRYLDYEALYVALERTRSCMNVAGARVLGVPYNMGCDRAGGDWNVVEAMINSVFKDADILIISVKL